MIVTLHYIIGGNYPHQPYLKTLKEKSSLKSSPSKAESHRTTIIGERDGRKSKSFDTFDENNNAINPNNTSTSPRQSQTSKNSADDLQDDSLTNLIGMKKSVPTNQNSSISTSPTRTSSMADELGRFLP